MENAGANLLCRFDEMRPGAALLIAFAPAKAFIHFSLSIFNFPLKSLFVTLCIFMTKFIHTQKRPVNHSQVFSGISSSGAFLRRKESLVSETMMAMKIRTKPMSSLGVRASP